MRQIVHVDVVGLLGESASSTPVIIISRAMARQMFPHQNPLGRRIRSWRDENVYREIVGVVGDVRHYGRFAALEERQCGRRRPAVTVRLAF